MTRKKCLRAQCRHAAQLMLKANLLDCVRLKTRFNSVSSLFSVSFTAADGEEPTSAGGSFFFIFLNAGDFPSRVRVCVRVHACEPRFHRQGCNAPYRLIDHGQQQPWLYNLSVRFITVLFKSPLAL